MVCSVLKYTHHSQLGGARINLRLAGVKCGEQEGCMVHGASARSSARPTMATQQWILGSVRLSKHSFLVEMVCLRLKVWVHLAKAGRPGSSTPPGRRPRSAAAGTAALPSSPTPRACRLTSLHRVPPSWLGADGAAAAHAHKLASVVTGCDFGRSRNASLIAPTARLSCSVCLADHALMESA